MPKTTGKAQTAQFAERYNDLTIDQMRRMRDELEEVLHETRKEEEYRRGEQLMRTLRIGDTAYYYDSRNNVCSATVKRLTESSATLTDEKGNRINKQYHRLYTENEVRGSS